MERRTRIQRATYRLQHTTISERVREEEVSGNVDDFAVPTAAVSGCCREVESNKSASFRVGPCPMLLKERGSFIT